MEGNKHLEPLTEIPQPLVAENQAGGNSAGRDLSELNAKLARENAQLTRELDLLRMVIDTLPDNIYAKDKNGRFILNNPAHAHDLGARSPADMKGKSDFDFFPLEMAQQFFDDEQKIIQTGKPVINQEQLKKRGRFSNEKRWSVSSKVIWCDEKGEILGTIGVTRDIHELKMAQLALRASEERLRESTAQLERSNRELQDFAYVASHDLQEPLRKIVVFGERLKEKAGERLDAETSDYLQRMQKAASRMQNLINDLLTFSRVTTKAQPFSAVDLAETARGVIDDLEGRIEMTKGRVEAGELPTIDAEPLQMRQLLQNLIGNALKFRRTDVPPVVKVEAKKISGVLPQAAPGAPAQDLCEMTVSDNGIGFDEKYLDRIFNVFQRLHTRNEYEGTGMGLAIARKIVVYHGGTITAKSKPGEGATFVVTLPMAHPKAEKTEINHE
jgi:PAS domain S-box-containing protein